MSWTKNSPVEKFVLNKEEYSPERWYILCELFGGSYDSTEVMMININSIEIYDEQI
jgi:hypothetical protein